MSSDPIGVASASIVGSEFRLESEQLPAGLAPERRVARLAQIDVRLPDLDLLFVDTGNELTLTRLRFATPDRAQTFLSRLIDAYEAGTATKFPDSWLVRHDTSGPGLGRQDDTLGE